MPGKQVKDWNMYHALRHRGYSKSSAAKIANSAVHRRRHKAVLRGRKRLSRNHGAR